MSIQAIEMRQGNRTVPGAVSMFNVLSCNLCTKSAIRPSSQSYYASHATMQEATSFPLLGRTLTQAGYVIEIAG